MSLTPDRRGMIFVELIIAVLPFLLLVLGLTQLMLLHAGKLVVMRAASAGARAAVVILDDDPGPYGGEPRNRAPAGSKRHAEIVRAAAGALVAAHPPSRREDDDDTLANAIGVPEAFTPLPQLLAPTAALERRVRVTFPGHEGGAFAPEDSVTVRVEHDFACLVPLARRVLCKGGRTRVLSSEATLPNQGAPYEYEAPPVRVIKAPKAVVAKWINDGAAPKSLATKTEPVKQLTPIGLNIPAPDCAGELTGVAVHCAEVASEVYNSIIELGSTGTIGLDTATTVVARVATEPECRHAATQYLGCLWRTNLERNFGRVFRSGPLILLPNQVCYLETGSWEQCEACYRYNGTYENCAAGVQATLPEKPGKETL